MSSTLDFDKIREMMSDSVRTAVKVDRNQDKRLWGEISLLMSHDDIDFRHAKTLLIKFLTMYGNINKVPPSHISKIYQVSKGLTETSIALSTARYYPEVSERSEYTLQRRYDNLKHKWDELVTLSFMFAEVSTDVTVDALTMFLLNEHDNQQYPDLGQLGDME